MKITKVSCMIMSFLLVLCISKVLSHQRGEDGKNAEALTYNDGKQETGLNFSMGSNGGYTLNVEAGFKKVETVKKLGPFEPIPHGPTERADEVPSTTDYYDGEAGLNAVKINCHIYKEPATCTLINSCGWCHNNNSCILGNNLGPMESCPRSKYQFSWPAASDTHYRITNQNMGSMNIRTYQRRNK